jgi:predicted AlkP superfamily pyrophosphatase or phosphodiesterase
MNKLIKFCLSLLVLSNLNSCSKDEDSLAFRNQEFVCREMAVKSEGSSVQLDLDKRSRKVLIIGIDGFRPDALKANITPFLHTLSRNRKNYFTRRHGVQRLTISGPNWSSILTGVNACKHRVENNKFEGNRLEEFPHFFKYIEEADSCFSTASIVHWTPINEFIANNHTDLTHEGTDLQVYNQGREMLLNQNPISPDILFLHFVDLDVAGHSFGFNPFVPEYANTLTTIDEYVKGLFSIIETKRMDGEDWMIFVVSDHGGDKKNHSRGSENRNINNTIFIINHPYLKFVRSYDSSQTDIVPTVLDFIGIHSEKFNRIMDGISLIDSSNDNL